MTQIGFDDTARLRVRVSGACGPARVETAVHRVLNHVLGLGINLKLRVKLRMMRPPTKPISISSVAMPPEAGTPFNTFSLISNRLKVLSSEFLVLSDGLFLDQGSENFNNSKFNT